LISALNLSFSDMSNNDFYRKSAERCRELAARARSEEERKLLLKLAESWEWLRRKPDPLPQGRHNLKSQRHDGQDGSSA